MVGAFLLFQTCSLLSFSLDDMSRLVSVRMSRLHRQCLYIFPSSIFVIICFVRCTCFDPSCRVVLCREGVMCLGPPCVELAIEFVTVVKALPILLERWWLGDEEPGGVYARVCGWLAASLYIYIYIFLIVKSPDLRDRTRRSGVGCVCVLALFLQKSYGTNGRGVPYMQQTTSEVESGYR